MKVDRLRLDGLAVIEPAVFGDARGFFYEEWNRERFAGAGFDFAVVQANVSRSVRGVLRGLHYQWPSPQGKLVSVIDGEVYDVAVDVRHGSPTFGQWEACVLSEANKKHFWIPEGYAHGFVVLSEHATFSYLCTTPYHAPSDRGVRWNDARIAIDWPVAQPALSAKDAAAPFLDEIPAELLPPYRA